ncbi:MAG: 1,4-alpha-glucan branching protein domain-containing protein [Clostridiaceae bacterium]
MEKDRLILMVQSSKTIYCYYNVSPNTIKDFEIENGVGSYNRAIPVIKCYSTLNGIEEEIKTEEINGFANNWFINLEKSGIDVFVKLGRMIDNKFITLMTSNTVSTLKDSISKNVKNEYINLNNNEEKTNPSKQGYVSFVLHSHLPYVRHMGTIDPLEERWLFEAMIECYLPLISAFDNMYIDDVDFKITMSLTPPLMEMLEDEYLNKNFRKYLTKTLKLIRLEIERTKENEELNKVAKFYYKRFTLLQKVYRKYNNNIMDGFRRYDKRGNLEIIASSATHALLPLHEQNKEAVNAQIKQGVENYKKHLGHGPKGFWLPECAYSYFLDEILKENNIEYFIMENKGVLYASPKPKNGTFEPISSPNNILSFARDDASSGQIWSSVDGYPGDYNYREFYRDIGYELPMEYIAPFINASGIRIDTGIKYNKITGKTEEKSIYNREKAIERVESHATHFAESRDFQVNNLLKEMDKPIVVCAFDTELFGHWWFEGPDFIEMFLRKSCEEWTSYNITTIKEYIKKIDKVQISSANPSSWGEESNFSVWLNMDNQWIYREIHERQENMVEIANKNKAPRQPKKRALNQLARELMLLESSDWPFIIKNKTTVLYAENRIKDHIERFDKIYIDICKNKIDEKYLNTIEKQDNIFKEINYKIYRK